MEIMFNKTCAFTGHRPQNFSWKYDETAPECILLKNIINQQISILTDNGYTDFLSGMALGVDIWAAEIVLNLRKKNPALKLHCILPCKNQAEKWPLSARNLYNNILAQADSLIYTSRQYHANCMLERNRFLVENASLLLAVYNGQKQSGTAATLRYAQKLNRQIITINPNTMQITTKGLIQNA